MRFGLGVSSFSKNAHASSIPSIPADTSMSIEYDQSSLSLAKPLMMDSTSVGFIETSICWKIQSSFSPHEKSNKENAFA